MKVIGKQIKEGEFKGFKYRHLVLTCTDILPATEKSEGCCCYTCKVKFDVDNNYKRVSIGDDIKVYFDRFGNVCEFNIESIL